MSKKSRNKGLSFRYQKLLPGRATRPRRQTPKRSLICQALEARYLMAGLGDSPLSPTEYQSTLGIGFSTDFFRNLNNVEQFSDAGLVELIDDLQDRGFNNLRLRCDGLVTGFADVGDQAAPMIDQAAMNRFLGQLDRVLNVALPKGFAITIAWQHNSAEGRISAQDGNNFVEWWRQVATHTAARNYLLSYNLMLEIGQQPFANLPHNGLYDFPEVYNDWTRRAMAAIRSVNTPGSLNADRIIIATAPQNTRTESLNAIASDVLADDKLMIEYHASAAGAQSTGRNAWQGNGSLEDRARLTDRIDAIQNFAATHGTPMYWGAWMPMDNRTSTLSQSEVDNFAQFFSYELAAEGIPWSLNKLENYYDTATLEWKQTEPFPNNLIIEVDQTLNRSLLGYGLGLAATGVPLAENPVLQNQYRDQILSGVNRIADFGTESIVSVYGTHAMSILTDSEQRTVVAAAELPVVGSATQPGRVIAAGKSEFSRLTNGGTLDTTQFYLNSLNWASHGLGTNARVVTSSSTAKAFLDANGFTNVTLRSDWENGLANADLLITSLSSATTLQQSAVTNFIAQGRGAFVGFTGWSMSGLPQDNSGNQVLRQWGLSWTDEVPWSFDGTILRGTPTGNAQHAARVMQTPGMFTPAEQNEAFMATHVAVVSIPASDPQLTTIRQQIIAAAPAATPTPATPVSDANTVAQLRIESAALMGLTASELFAHRTAFSYGAIPAGAARVTESRTFTINQTNTQTQWLSTGLYAAPGEVVTLNVPAGLVGAGWQWKIGSHDDENAHLTSFSRMPIGTSRDFVINSATIQAGSVYGGMIYLVKPDTPANFNQTINVTIANALKAPTFVLGQTTDADWTSTIRNYPAPQAELISNNLIISLHSSTARSLTNPTSVMTYWNDIVSVQGHLVNAPVPRTRPERIDDDLQISNGWMHAGYPIAAYDNNLANMIDSDPGDDWGFVHELGHNHQSTYWTFSTETEVTVNILSMRSYDSLGTVPNDGWAGMWTDAGRAARIPAFIAGGRLRTDAANSLVAYAQLRAGFGWGPFEQFFRSYQTDSPANLPTTDQQERDQWVTRFSNIVGRNLGPFFQAWGFNPSQAALNAVASLPAWSKIEAVTPNLNRFTTSGTPITFDPRPGFVDIFGGPLQLRFDSPRNGSLVTNGNGSVTYTPAVGWNGEETIQYTVTNEFGDTASGSVTILTGTQVTVSTAVDTYLRQSNPTRNYATANPLLVDAATGTVGVSTAQSLLRFDNLFGTDPGQIPPNAEITSATLSFTVTDSGTSLEFHRMLQPWDASTATWNSMNAGIQTDGIEAATVADLSTGSVSTGLRSYDVRNSLNAWKANPSTNHGWAILATSTNGVDVASAESATPPSLSVTYYVPRRDTTAPVALVQPLPLTTSTKDITLNVSLSDSAGPGDTFVSGVASYDLYVAIDQGNWNLLAGSVPASQTTFTFSPESNRRYWFRADARDLAGNVEVSLSAEANTKTTDIAPPVTSVVSAASDTTGLFTLSLQGTDAGDSGLEAFQVYVKVDNGPFTALPRVLAGLKNSSGVYSATTTYQGLRDSVSHTYTFFTRGIDFAGNVEAAPESATGDWQGTRIFNPPVSLAARSIDVQNSQTQRSYVRYVDVLFNDAGGLADLIAAGRIQVERFGIDRTSPTQGTGTLIGVTAASVRGNSITLDFGANGIGGIGNTGNGFYRIALDLDGDGQFDDAHFEFFRLWADSNGDGIVNLADRTVTEDLTGDGVVDARDRSIHRTELNKRLSTSLYRLLDD